VGKHWVDCWYGPSFSFRPCDGINTFSFTGSTLGAALAARDLGLGRTILFIGDGSM